MQCFILGYDFLSKHGAVIDISKKSVPFSKSSTLKLEVSPLPLLDYDGLNCHDILQLLSKVISGEFYKAELLLSIEHAFTVNGHPFSVAARKLGQKKQSKLFKQIDYMLANEMI